VVSTAAEIVITGSVVATCGLVALGAEILRRKASRLLDDMRRENEEDPLDKSIPPFAGGEQ
jgi:hypothetical protein